ncbi:hypothetical protein [Spirillospora sp. NPDC048819]|uniref:hypothetical protein n=1 Tax=Spirillospora sp. NPDC048819 TaxID=3155268 RepID=UPI0033F9E54E
MDEVVPSGLVNRPAVDRASVTNVDRACVDPTGVDRTGANRTGVDRTSVNRTVVDRTSVDCAVADRTGVDRMGVNGTGVNGTAGSELGNDLPEACDRKSDEAKNTDMTQPSRGKYSARRAPVTGPQFNVFLRYFPAPYRAATGR